MIIALSGFMGCGKSTVGRILALRTGFSFIDLDEYIEISTGLSVAEIFSLDGEEGFRSKESLYLKEVLENHLSKNLILALGGGTVLKDENVAAMRDAGCLTIYLEVPLEVLQSRLENDSGQRPLLNSGGFADLLSRRLEKYEVSADFKISCGELPPEEIAGKCHDAQYSQILLCGKNK